MMLGILLVISLGAQAGPMETVKERHDRFMSLMSADTAESRSLLAQEIDQFFDYPEISQAILGDAWTPLTGAQRQDFISHLRPMWRRAYERKLRAITGMPVVEATSEPAGAMRRVTLHMKPAGPEPTTSIAILIVQSGGAWRGRDLVLDDASVAKILRSQFVKILQTDGFDVLLQKMKAAAEREP